MNHLIKYSAAPAVAAFKEIDIQELEAIQSELQASSVPESEWGQDVLAQDCQVADTAMQYLLRGETVFMARDEDGVYFATE